MYGSFEITVIPPQKTGKVGEELNEIINIQQVVNVNPWVRTQVDGKDMPMAWTAMYDRAHSDTPAIIIRDTNGMEVKTIPLAKIDFTISPDTEKGRKYRLPIYHGGVFRDIYIALHLWPNGVPRIDVTADCKESIEARFLGIDKNLSVFWNSLPSGWQFHKNNDEIKEWIQIARGWVTSNNYRKVIIEKKLPVGSTETSVMITILLNNKEFDANSVLMKPTNDLSKNDIEYIGTGSDSKSYLVKMTNDNGVLVWTIDKATEYSASLASIEQDLNKGYEPYSTGWVNIDIGDGKNINILWYNKIPEFDSQTASLSDPIKIAQRERLYMKNRFFNKKKTLSLMRKDSFTIKPQKDAVDLWIDEWLVNLDMGSISSDDWKSMLWKNAVDLNRLPDGFKKTDKLMNPGRIITKDIVPQDIFAPYNN